jgi:hypothetical protein
MSSRIADPAQGLAALFELDEPLAIAFYPDHAEKELLMDQVRALAAHRVVNEVNDVQAALDIIAATPAVNSEESAPAPSKLIVIDPENESAAVTALDQNREQFLDRGVQLLLLLLRDGSGEHALTGAPQLASFARSASFEVAAKPSNREADLQFVAEYGTSAREWLLKWRQGELPDTAENNLILSEALVLEDAGEQ